MTARNRVVREPYATWCGRTPVEIIHGLLPDYGKLSKQNTREATTSIVESTVALADWSGRVNNSRLKSKALLSPAKAGST